jgi:hypothetical protein
MILMRINAATETPSNHLLMQWQLIANAPFDRDLELAVIDRDGLHALVFPCGRVIHGWIKSGTQERIEVQPTHWRLWISAPSARSDP